MKKTYINKGRFSKIFAVVLCALLISATFCITASAAMGLPNGMGRSGSAGMENNIPENGNATPSDTAEGNLGDTDGDGVVEDKGTGEGIIGDIGDMGSDIVSDIGEAGSDIVSDIGEGVGIGNGADGTNGNNTDRAPADSGTTNDANGNGGNIVAIVIAIIVAIALIILIIALIPKNKNKH
ncbi:MAG: hypothetical protein IJZ89_03975 [Clostridia bacterium]|nr:hypothetical protein [Clostridia bacterium]